MSSNEEILKWRFDISTFRLIGRELITDRITALFELVKNSYDANAKRVNVIFKNITPIQLFFSLTVKINSVTPSRLVTETSSL